MAILFSLTDSRIFRRQEQGLGQRQPGQVICASHGSAVNSWRSKTAQPELLPISCLHDCPLSLIVMETAM
jgi:hypothetical protein